jgi:hypothetical protein
LGSAMTNFDAIQKNIAGYLGSADKGKTARAARSSSSKN